MSFTVYTTDNHCPPCRKDVLEITRWVGFIRKRVGKCFVTLTVTTFRFFLFHRGGEGLAVPYHSTSSGRQLLACFMDLWCAVVLRLHPHE